MRGELYCDGGIVTSNPAAVAIHEARILFPDIPIELLVSCGTGEFIEVQNEPKIGWDAIISQIVNSATDGKCVLPILIVINELCEIINKFSIEKIIFRRKDTSYSRRYIRTTRP